MIQPSYDRKPPMSRRHRLKTWPEYFKAVSSGAKTFEVRKHDRDFQVGDLLILVEFDPANEQSFEHCYGYTGNIEYRLVSYVLPGGQFGIEPGYCVLGLLPRND